MKVSAVAIVFNEEKNIKELCETVAWLDEIVIVDSYSTDRTIEIAKNYTDKIFYREFLGYRDKHEFADAQATGDWLLWIDADERITPELRASIERLKEMDDASLPDGFLIARKTWYLKRWIRHSGWYPDCQMRLYRKDKSYWGGTPPHETARVEGKVEKLDGDFLHYTKQNLSEHNRVVDSYTSLAADHLSKNGKKVSGTGIFIYPLATFLRTFILKQGFRDGVPGLIIAFFASYYVFLRYAKIWEHNNAEE